MRVTLNNLHALLSQRGAERPPDPRLGVTRPPARSSRHSFNVAWTLVVTWIYVFIVVVALTAGRRARWFLRVGLVVLALVGWFGYRFAMGSTAYVISS